MNELRAAAKYYASVGWKVFPLKPNAKTPLTAHGVKDATSDAAQIEAWWMQWPTANIGFACGGEDGAHVVDVDVDIENGVDGRKAISELAATGKLLPETVCQNTPRGGAHYFYQAKVRPQNKNSFMPGVDIRSGGYYVLLPPSIHPNGGKYQWATGLAPWEHGFAEYPDFMRPACTSQAPCSAQAQQPATAVDPPGSDIIQRAKLYLAACDPAVQGHGGHDKLLWAASALVNGFLLPDDVTLWLLETEFNPRCQPPWDMGIPADAKDFRRKVSEARKNPPHDKPLGWLLNDPAYAPPSDKLPASVAEFITKVRNGEITPASSQAANPADQTTSPAKTSGTQVSKTIDETSMDVVSASAYLLRTPPPVESIIPGLMDRGDKVFIVGQSKARKSFFTLMLALCLACGIRFLNWNRSAPQKVLLLQFELKPSNYWRRVKFVANACGITAKDIGDRLQIINLRGKTFSLDDLQALSEGYDLAIVDPFYKLLDREGADEISAPDVARVLGKIDKIAESGPAVIIVHHAVKGHIGDRQTIDRAGGSGMIARDCDCLFTLSPHADHSDEWLVLESVLRNHRSPEAQTIEFREGKFIVREDVPSEVKTSRHVNRQRQAGQSAEVMAIEVGQWLIEKMKTTDVQDRIKNEYSVGRDKVNEVVRQLERNGFVRKKDNTFQGHWTISPPGKLTKLTDGQTSLFSH